MSNYQRSNGHTVSSLTAHLVWSTKYRYPVLHGDIQSRCRSMLIQICEAEDVVILKGVVSRDHVHMHLSYRPSQSLSQLVKRLKEGVQESYSKSSQNLGENIGDNIFEQSVLAVGVQGISQMRW